MNPILELRDVSFTYNKGLPTEHRALRHINLTVEHGEFIALIGHTGSGKSTLIQHLNGLLRPTDGKVLYCGKDIFEKASRLRQQRFHVGLLFQYPEYQLFEETVAADISYGPTNMELENSEITARVHRAIKAVGLPESILEKSPFALSGGQKRRVALAGVLAMQPEVLVLDEPTAGLDPAAREEMFSLIADLHEQSGTTIVLVTHSMEDAARIASRLVVLEQGRILTTGTPEEVFAHAEELERTGLTVPQVTKVLCELKRRGLPVNTACYTVEQAAEALLVCRKEVRSC